MEKEKGFARWLVDSILLGFPDRRCEVSSRTLVKPNCLSNTPTT